MDKPSIAEQLVDALERPDGNLKKRPVHTIGIGASGIFAASEVARNYCVAEHFKGDDFHVSVRFSNGSGNATQHDGWSDVRGMATRFHLSKGTETDLIAMTLPEFFAPTPEKFLEFAKMAAPKPYLREPPWRKIPEITEFRCAFGHPFDKFGRERREMFR